MCWCCCCSRSLVLGLKAAQYLALLGSGKALSYMHVRAHVIDATLVWSNVNMACTWGRVMYVYVCTYMWCVHKKGISGCDLTRGVCVRQIKWGKGSASNPYVIVLEAGLDSLDFDEDLPLAPWL